MRVSIVGVLPDGSGTTAAPAVQPISVPQGADSVVAIAVTKADGTALNLGTYTLKLTIRTAATGGQLIGQITGSITSAPSGLATFTIPGSLTKPLLGTYNYDVFAADASNNRDEVVLASFLEVFAAPGA